MPHTTQPLARRLITCGALGVLYPATAAGQIDAYWLNAADGTWTTASNWSVDPALPFNGFPNPLDRYHAHIDATGSPYTVTLDFDIEIDNLTIDSADVTFLHTAGLLGLNGGTLDLRTGHYLLDGGSLGNMTVTSSGGTIGFGAGDHTFDGITFDQIDLTIAAGQTIYAPNDLVINSGNVYMGEGESGQFAELVTSGLDGNATYHLNFARILGGFFQISRDVEVRTATATFNEIEVDTLVNRGTITADITGSRIRLDGGTAINTALGLIQAVNGATIDGSIDNRGLIYVGAGSEMSLGALVNTGTITAEAGAQLYLSYGTVDIGTLGNLNIQGASLGFDGDLDLQGSSYDLDGAHWTLASDSRVRNGTLTNALGGSLYVNSSDVQLIDVVLDQDLVIGPMGRVSTPNGIEVTADHAIILQRTGEAGSNAQPRFSTDSLSGAGELRFERDQALSGNSGVLFSMSGPLVIGADFTVRTESAHGRISAENVTNFGTIHAQNPYRLSSSFGTIDNQGTLRASQAGVLDLTTLTNNGHIEIDTFGALYLGGVWTNQGTILLDQGTLRFGGQFNTAQLNGLTVVGGLIQITGEVDATANALATHANGTWVIGGLPGENDEARLTGSVDTTAGQRLIATDNVAFNQLSLDGRLDAIDSFQVRFEGDTTLISGAEIHVMSSVSSSLRFAEVQSVLGNGDIVFDTLNTPGQLTMLGTGELTLATGVTLRTGTGSGQVLNGTLNNAGTIRAEGTGNTLLLNAAINNTGAIEANNGGIIEVNPLNLTSVGTIHLDNGAFRLDGSFSIDDLPGYTQANGGWVEIVGSLNLLGQTWDIDGSHGRLVLRDGSAITNGVVDAGGGTALIFGDGLTEFTATLIGDAELRDDAFVRFGSPTPLADHTFRIISVNENTALTMTDATLLAGATNTTILFEGPGNEASITLSAQGALELGEGVTVRATGGTARIGGSNRDTILRGTVRAESTGTAVRLVTDDNGHNNGLIEALPGNAIAFEGHWTNSGTIRLGASDTGSTAEHTLRLTADSRLEIGWDGPSGPGEPAVLGEMFVFERGGTLAVFTSEAYTPERGDALLLFEAVNDQGAFESLTVDEVSADHYALIRVGRLVSLYLPYFGDATLDGRVDVEDLDLLLANWGETAGPNAWASGDFDQDGTVGQADLNLLLANWGNQTQLGALPVPEPASGVILLGGVSLLASTRRRTKQPCNTLA